MIKAVIIGASGYTGAELIRILHRHPEVNILALTADRHAGQPVEAIYPHLGGLGLPEMVPMDQVDFNGIDVAFCCLPHATTQEVVATLPASVKVIDLSADFRLRDPEVYAEWYGHEHRAVALQKEAVYGLTEHYRKQVKEARLVACPGCYPTSALLPLLPLLKAGVVETEGVIVDAKSGVTGAGRKATEALLLTEVNEGLKAYSVGQHRHMPEIEQELAAATGNANVRISFTPHLVPMNRGILSTIYVTLAEGRTTADLRGALLDAYRDEPFVEVLSDGHLPQTHYVRGSNKAVIGLVADRRPGHAILICAIDNLVKGASGQAVQNMNAMFGLEETTGLKELAVFP